MKIRSGIAVLAVSALLAAPVLASAATATDYQGGYATGYKYGYDIGYNDGKRENSNAGYSKGYEKGYDEGLKEGKTEGYENGVSDSVSTLSSRYIASNRWLSAAIIVGISIVGCVIHNHDNKKYSDQNIQEMCDNIYRTGYSIGYYEGD